MGNGAVSCRVRVNVSDLFALLSSTVSVAVAFGSGNAVAVLTEKCFPFKKTNWKSLIVFISSHLLALSCSMQGHDNLLRLTSITNKRSISLPTYTLPYLVFPLFVVWSSRRLSTLHQRPHFANKTSRLLGKFHRQEHKNPYSEAI